MGRIRTLKPEFFTSRSLAKVSHAARLTFAGLWTQADDHGRGVADTRILKGAIWPLEDGIGAPEIDAHLKELSTTGHVVLYVIDGDAYFEVANWEKHQAAAYRRGEAKHPAPTPETVCTFLHDSARLVVQESAYRERTGEDADGPIVARMSWAINEYAMSVCLASKNTNQRFRDAVYDKALKERGPVLRALLERQPDCTDNDLLVMLGIGEDAPKAVAQHFDPECELCGGEGIYETEPNTFARCDCLSNVRELRPA